MQYTSFAPALIERYPGAGRLLGPQFGIRSIPTLALFRGGREIARQPGAMGTTDIVNWVRSQL